MNDTMPLLPIENIPATPPRPGHEGEAIFLAKWQQFAERAPDEFRAIFYDCYREWTQQQATAAAGVVMWLGTNVGHSFLLRCEALAREMRSPDNGYVAAWAFENRRQRHVNYGLRTAEWLMTRETPVVGLSSAIDWHKVPEVTLAELDAMECVVIWLSTSQGRAFVAACEAEIQAVRKNKHLFGPSGGLEAIGQP